MGRVIPLALAGLLATACPEEASPPRPAPWDGLVFLRESGAGGADLWLGRVSDGAVAPLIETPELVESSPHWVSSVLRIAYLARPLDRPEGSRVMLIDPEDGRVVTASERSSDTEGPAWVSPDGKRLAFAFEAPPGQRPPRGVRILDPMSAQDQTIGGTGESAHYEWLEFSPSVSFVVAQVRRPGRGDDVWLLGGEGKRGALLNDPRFRDTRPRFAHGGAQIFFTRIAHETPQQTKRRTAGIPPLGGGDICRVFVETRAVQCPVQSPDARESDVAPSPTAPEIAFVRARREEPADVFLADLDGTNERRLTGTPEPEAALSWSPDGSRLAFEAGVEGARRVRVVDREGNLLFDAPGFSPDWTPLLLRRP
jgi:Tol biopolymer transport system component